MKKTIKVFLGVLISALVLGLASCQQANGPQDVKVVDLVTQTQMHDHAYSVTGTLTPNTTGASALTISGDAFIRWSNNIGSDTNYTSYTITGNYYYLATSAATTYTSGSINLTIYKIGGKYYQRETTNGKTELVDISSRLTGNPEGSSFTYTTASTTTSWGSAITFTRR